MTWPFHNYEPHRLASDKPARKVCKPKPPANPFDGDDHKARQACTHLPKTHPNSRADHIKRSNSFTNGSK